MIPSSFYDELFKLAVSDTEADEAIRRVEKLQQDTPTAAQAGRYGAIGAAVGAISKPVGDVVEHGLKGGLKKSTPRAIASAALKAGIAASAVPIARHHFDRKHEIDVLKDYIDEHQHLRNPVKVAAPRWSVTRVNGQDAYEQHAREQLARDQAVEYAKQRELDTSLALGSGAIGGLAGISVKPLVTGRTRLYHGTAPSVVPTIKQTGLRPSADTKVPGVIDLALAPDIKEPAKKLVYLAKDKMSAREYYQQAALLEDLARKYPNSPATVVENLLQERKNPAYLNKIRNPVDNAGVLVADVPLWQSEIASRLKANPEARGSFEEFLKDKSPIDRMFKREELKNVHNHFKNTVNIEGGLDPKYIKGGKGYKALDLAEIGQYIKAKPKRFAAGAALGVGTLGLGGYSAKKFYDAFKRTYEPSEQMVQRQTHMDGSEVSA